MARRNLLAGDAVGREVDGEGGRDGRRRLHQQHINPAVHHTRMLKQTIADVDLDHGFVFGAAGDADAEDIVHGERVLARNEGGNVDVVAA